MVKKNRRNKRIVIGCAFLTVLCVIGGFTIYTKHGARKYSDVFYPKTTLVIDGESYEIGGSTPEEVREKLYSKNDTLTIETRTGQETLPGEAVGLSVTEEPSIETLLAGQDAKHWLKEVRKEWVYETKKVRSIDPSSFKKAVESLPFMLEDNWTYPENAYISKTADAFEIVPETQGTALDKTKAEETLRSAFVSGQSNVNLEQAQCYLTAAVTKEHPDLNQQVNDINDLINNTITLDMTDATETVQKEQLLAWLNHDDATGGVLLDSNAVSAYVATLAKKYNTYQTSRPFRTINGEEIYVGGGADDTYGFWMNQDKTTEALCEAVMNKSDRASVEWKVPAKTRNTANGDIGSTYVEVSIGQQHVWYIQNGEVVFDAPVVTGQGNDSSRMTHTGVFRIWNRKTPYHMKKYNVDCLYWMAFTWDGQGFHDASWRSDFGGNIYLSSGSHGCCNMSAQDAKTLYELTGWDTPVVIY